MSRKIPDALVLQAAELVKQGTKLKDAAALVGHNPDEISKKLRAIGIAVESKFRWGAHTDEIIALYGDGFGTTAIAKHFGMPIHSASTVRQILKAHGVETRGRSAANRSRVSRESTEIRRSNSDAARLARRANMVRQAAKDEILSGIGAGESEIAGILRAGGLIVQQQVEIGDNYLIDLAVGSVAVEVKTSPIHAHAGRMKSARFEKLIECGYFLIFVVVNHIPTLMNHADDLVAIIDRAQRNPPKMGEYWVVRCSLEQIGADFDVDHWSVERRSPKTDRIIR